MMSVSHQLQPLQFYRWPRKVMRRSARLLRYRSQALQRRRSAAMRRILRIRSAVHWRRALSAHRSDPFAYLYECWGTACPYNRLRFPDRRRAFTRAVYGALPPVTGGTIEVLFYGSGGMLHELQLLDGIMKISRPKRVIVSCVDSSYGSYHCLSARGSYVGRAEQLWASRMQSSISWFAAQYPDVSWSWYSAATIPVDGYAAVDRSFCFAIDTQLLHEIPYRYTIFQLAHDSDILGKGNAVQVHARYFHR